MDVSDLSINCSLALHDVAPRERAEKARSLGYRAVEFWWPFSTQEPTNGEMREFVDDVRSTELSTVLLNFPGGGADVQDRGLLCVPGREDDFLRGAETAIRIGRQLGVSCYNPMVGNTDEDWTSESAAFTTAVKNLLRVAPLIADSGAVIVLEPLSGFPHAALRTFAQACELVLAARAEGARNVAVLFDLYHAAVNNDPLPDLRGCIDLIGHVQIADHPGRGWPGTGTLPLTASIAALRAAGYAGRIGLECAGPALSCEAVTAILTTL